ncbi:MAG: 50S ribosomal protein L22 [Candidatus Omnitrophica bacterium]|nr:50S ribosomal protein L22 [Candidatus Omnitrophota bacterium]
MIAKVRIKYLKISPRKLRLVLPLIRKKTVPVALSILDNTNKKAAGMVYKALSSAVANAKRFPNINENQLFVSEVFADGGPIMHRFRARSMGMANEIKKRTAHLTIELDTLVPVKAKAAPAAKKVKKVAKTAKVTKKE